MTNSDLIVYFYCGKNIVLAEKQVFKRLESLAKDSNLFFLSQKLVKDSNPRTRVRRFDSPLLFACNMLVCNVRTVNSFVDTRLVPKRVIKYISSNQ
jgi:hypothetical protein